MITRNKGGTRGTLYKQLAFVRIEDARILLEHNRNHGALYLAGYSVECALKWAITCRMGEIYLPADLEIHDLEKLMGKSGLAPQLTKDAAIAPLFSALVDDWGPHGRYAADNLDTKKAQRLYNQTNKFTSG